MNKEKTLLLLQTDADTDPVFQKWIDNGYIADLIFKELNKPLRILRRVLLKSENLNLKFLYQDWIKQLDKYSTVIIHASELTYNIVHYIKKKYPKMRVIVWYWNKVTENNKPQKYGDNIELWSFDKNDCKEYGMKYNIQYYEPSFHNIVDKKNIMTDIFFVGHDEGRKKMILDFQTLAENMGLVCDIRISDTYGGWFIPYAEVEKKVLTTKSILELNRIGQSGVTLRAMESLFYCKKLITNNKDIVNEPYYNKNNIFIIGEDDSNQLYSFVNSSYDHTVDKYMNEYNLEAWFNRFDN